MAMSLRDCIHIEPSSRCTIACPACPRTLHRGEYTIDDCDIDLMIEICRGYSRVVMCGNHGDPIYHPRLHELISGLIAAEPNQKIDIITNGAFRSRGWWKDLAGLLRAGDSVMFSIDGMPNSNHLYRVNSRWESIETAITELRTNSKLYLLWKWILFSHNEDSVCDGMKLASSLGFDRFVMVRSDRYDVGVPAHRPQRPQAEIYTEVETWLESQRAADLV